MTQGDILTRKIRHIEMVQSVITRMNQDSFLVKGWAVTLLVAIMAVGFNNHAPRVCILALLLVLMFWGLDTFYVHRKLHRRIAADIRDGTDQVPLFDMDTNPYEQIVGPTWKCAFTRTVGSLFLSVVCRGIFAHEKNATYQVDSLSQN